MCAEPLSTYPSYKQLSQLKETFVAAKKDNIDFNWKDVSEGLLAIGEYELAERVCTEQGWLCNSKCFSPSHSVT